MSKRGDKWNLQKTLRKLICGLERFDLSYSLLVEIKYYYNGIFLVYFEYDQKLGPRNRIHLFAGSL